MIKNIIFDLGNVLLNYKPREFLLRFTTDQARINSFISKVSFSTTWFELDRGTLSLEKAREILSSRYPEELDLLVPYFEHWLEILTPIQDRIEILGPLKKKGYKLFILSNFIEEAFKYVIEQYDFFSLFDGRVISYEEKVIKPENAIYEILLNRYNLIPQECVFLDDHFNFLKPAKQLGMATILVRQDTDLQKKFRKIGIIL